MFDIDSTTTATTTATTNSVMSGYKETVHVEAVVKDSARHLLPGNIHSLQKAIVRALDNKFTFYNGSIPLIGEGDGDGSSASTLASVLDSLRICDLPPNHAVSRANAELSVHVYALYRDEPEKEFLEGDEEVCASEQWNLPHATVAPLWDSIIVPPALKSQLLGYCTSAMMFSALGVDPSIISWNRMVLLYGPPGTGKTTLCKALAQKVFIRSNCSGGAAAGVDVGVRDAYTFGLYDTGTLVEINTHSLFSRYFSESGKLVLKLFEYINELCEDPRAFVAVLIDEVESLVMTRAGFGSSGSGSSGNNNEPADATRVVNAVLTSLDGLKRRSNVLVLCTSNLVNGIDPAFRDRCDLQLFVPNPCLEARAQILTGCLQELTDKGVICCHQSGGGGGGGGGAGIMSVSDMLSNSTNAKATGTGIDTGIVNTSLGTCACTDPASTTATAVTMTVTMTMAQQFQDILVLSEGLSGRQLRKSPLTAHAFYLPPLTTTTAAATLGAFVGALHALMCARAAEAEAQAEARTDKNIHANCPSHRSQPPQSQHQPVAAANDTTATTATVGVQVDPFSLTACVVSSTSSSTTSAVAPTFVFPPPRHPNPNPNCLPTAALASLTTTPTAASGTPYSTMVNYSASTTSSTSSTSSSTNYNNSSSYNSKLQAFMQQVTCRGLGDDNNSREHRGGSSGRGISGQTTSTTAATAMTTTATTTAVTSTSVPLQITSKSAALGAMQMLVDNDSDSDSDSSSSSDSNNHCDSDSI